MGRIKYTVFFFVVLFLSGNLNAQNETFHTANYKIRDGLPSNYISGITVDEQGFIWLGAKNGLYRFDSYDFQLIKPDSAETPSINSPQIETILADSKGNIWGGYTLNGVVRYSTVDQSITQYPANTNDSTSICGGTIRTICEDKEGNIWIGSLTGGLTKLNPKTNEIKHYFRKRVNGKLKLHNIGQVVCTQDSNIWAASLRGLYKYDRKSDDFKRVKLTKKKKGIKNLCSLAEDTARNCLWIGGWGRSLFKLNLKNNKAKKIRAWFYNPFAIHPDSKGVVWIGTWGGGLHRYYPDSAKIERHNFEGDSLLQANTTVIRKITEDSSGDIWFSTNNSGIFSVTRSKKFRRVKFPFISKQRPITYDIHYLGDKLLAGTTKGLFIENDSGYFDRVLRKKGKRFLPASKHYRKIEQIGDNIFFNYDQIDILKVNPKDSTYYIEFYGKIKGGSYNSKRKATGMTVRDSLLILTSLQYSVNIFKQRQNGDFLFMKTLEVKEDKEGYLPSPVSNCLLHDSKNKVWIGNIGGLFLLKKGLSVVSINKLIVGNKKLTSDYITHLAEDKAGRILVCTSRGFNVLSPIEGGKYKLTTFNQSNGLPESYVRSCNVDKKGGIWINTNTKIIRIDLENEKAEVFGQKDGLLLLDNFSQGTAISPDGKIAFGANGEIIEFDPTKTKISQRSPKLEISVLSVMNTLIQAGKEYNGRIILEKDISHTNKIEMTHREKEFSITVSLLDYQKNKKNFYQYRLEGFDDEWVELGEKRLISLTNLPPKKYKLHVRAFTSEGFSVELPRPLIIKVTPPWWKTTWFRITLIISIIVGAISFYTYRMNAIKAKNRELERLVEIRTQEIRQQSEEITAQRDSLEVQKNQLESANHLLKEKQDEILTQNEEIKQQSEEITAQRDNLEVQKDKLENANLLLKERQDEILTQNEEIRQQSEEISAQRDNLAQQKNKLVTANEQLKEQQEEILTQNEEIRQQTEEIAAQRDHVEMQNQEIQAGLKNMQALSEFGQKLTSSLSLDSILPTVHSYVASIVETHAFAIGFYRRSKQTIDYHAVYRDGEPKDLYSTNFNPDSSFSSWAIQNEEEIFENDVPLNYNKYFEELPDFYSDFKANSLMVFPLFSEGRVLGVFSVYSRNREAYSQKDFSFVKSLSAYISIAIANARLYGEVNKKNEHIRSSITYARNIQETILPLRKNMNKFLDTFVLFMPKDIVSGDFYWHTDISRNGKKEAIYAVVDCTGHGVPGAFMSLIGNRILNRIVNERQIFSPENILTELNHFIVEALKQETSDNNDGMDVALCKVTQTENGAHVVYAGAKRNLIFVKPSGELDTLKGVRKSIGGVRARRNSVSYEAESIEVEKGTLLYLSTDGYTDQNGQGAKKFGSIAFRDLLTEISQVSVDEQEVILRRTIEVHMGRFEQRDDITILGIKV